MDASHLFTAALRLRSPWRVGSADFRDADGDGREPHITIGFEPGRGFMLLFEAWVWLYRPVRMSIDCRLNRDRIRCPGSRFLSFFTNRDKPISAGHMLRNTKSAE